MKKEKYLYPPAVFVDANISDPHNCMICTPWSSYNCPNRAAWL